MDFKLHVLFVKQNLSGKPLYYMAKCIIGSVTI